MAAIVKVVAVETCGGSITFQLRGRHISAATGVFATAADLHHLGSLGVLAVFAAVLTVRFGMTITWAMRTFVGIGISHRATSFAFRGGWRLRLRVCSYARRVSQRGQARSV